MFFCMVLVLLSVFVYFDVEFCVSYVVEKSLEWMKGFGFCVIGKGDFWGKIGVIEEMNCRFGLMIFVMFMWMLV